MTQTLTGRRSRRRRAPSVDALDADLAARMAAAALSEHPGATVDRVEGDAEGRYTVHLVTWFGQQLVVPVDRDLTVSGWVALAR